MGSQRHAENLELEQYPKVSEWVSEYRNTNSRQQMCGRLRAFLIETGLTIDQFTNMDRPSAKHLIKIYVAEQEKKGIPSNTILSKITAPRAYMSFLGKEIPFRHSELPKLEAAKDKHQFSNGDLSKMFDVADIRGKAIISLGVSLGWAISDVLALDRKFIETLISRAKDENEQFIFFNTKRIKTSAKAFGVLNPLAVEWVSKWLAMNKSNTIFDISEDQINKELQRLAEEAQLKLIGKVSFHCFRAWTFNSLIKAGLSEYESKLIVGKSIPLSDSTYLTLEEHIREVYPQKYDKYFNIKPIANEEIKSKYQSLEEENRTLKDLVSQLVRAGKEQEERLKQLQESVNKKYEEV